MRQRVLIVDDEATVRDVVRDCLSPRHDVSVAADVTTGLQLLREELPDVLLSDVRMPGGGGHALVARALHELPDLAVVIVTGHATLDDFLTFFRLGVADFVLKPFSPAELERSVQRALATRRLRAENARLRAELGLESADWPLLGDAPASVEVRARIARVAPTDTTVLVTGPSGTGKELVARAIHASSARAAGPFVAVHCGALPGALLESELFGHARGAFTGADRTRPGRFEEADGGTLLLDEIGTMPPATQSRLLRVLQEREVARVGEDVPRRVDVRIVAATNADLEADVRAGTFREDLFHRLDVFRIRMPTLEERAADIPVLARHCLEACCQRMGRPPVTLSQHALRRLSSHSWPGNVRELSNVLERAVILTSPREVIEGEDLLLGEGRSAGAGSRRELPEDGLDLPALLDSVETELITQALRRTSDNRQHAARLLGLNRTTLVQKLRRREAATDARGNRLDA
jgi:DNA-binding NtrC family response regulator